MTQIPVETADILRVALLLMTNRCKSIGDRQQRFYSRLRLMTVRCESVDRISDASFQRRDGRAGGKVGDASTKRLCEAITGRFERVRRPCGIERKPIAPGSIVGRPDLGNQLATSDDISDGNRNVRRKCTLSMRMRHFWECAFRRYLHHTSRQQTAPRG